MIRQVELENFRCFRKVTVDLEPLTVLIGKNDTGKSSFLESLCTLSSVSPARGSIDSVLSEHVTFGEPKDSVSVAIRWDDRTLRMRRSNPPLSNREYAETCGLYRGVPGPYRIDTRALRQPAKTFSLAGKPLPSNGLGLVDALDSISYERFGELRRAFLERVPTIKSFDKYPVQEGTKGLFFDLVKATRVPAAKMSDGPLLLLAFLAIVYHGSPPPLIMVEEPENGVHPKQLEHIIRFLGSLTQRENPVQVVITTHSPYVLDFVPKESVRVFTRGEDGHAHVSKMHEIAKVRELLEQGYTLGEVWYNTDEDELVAGKKA